SFLFFFFSSRRRHTRCLSDGVQTCALPISLLFTNTRAQAELWFKSILVHRPRWESRVAVHHGSLDRGLREDVEERLRTGKLRCEIGRASCRERVEIEVVGVSGEEKERKTYR